MKTPSETDVTEQPERVARGSLRRMVGRIREWLTHRRMMKACDESSKRMNNLTREQRRQLGDDARKIMYPNGYWTCRNHGDVIEYNVPAGEVCPICNSSNV